MPAESLDYLGAIDENAKRLVDAAERAGVDAPVPSCPEWTVADLLAHIGRVHRWAAGNVRQATPDEFWTGHVDIPGEHARVDWVREGAVELVAALNAAAPTDPAWTFAGPGTASFWSRRQAHETAMHRVDAELAAGDAPTIAADLAADGLDELLTLLTLFGNPGAPPDSVWATPITGDDDSIHLHCTDVEGEWLVRLTPTGLEFDRVHAKGDAAARGGASDLLTWLAGRASIDRLEILGDTELLERWRVQART
jgi:uncharacterized protein (TIGR03083 family)